MNGPLGSVVAMLAAERGLRALANPRRRYQQGRRRTKQDFRIPGGAVGHRRAYGGDLARFLRRPFIFQFPATSGRPIESCEKNPVILTLEPRCTGRAIFL